MVHNHSPCYICYKTGCKINNPELQKSGKVTIFLLKPSTIHILVTCGKMPITNSFQWNFRVSLIEMDRNSVTDDIYSFKHGYLAFLAYFRYFWLFLMATNYWNIDPKLEIQQMFWNIDPSKLNFQVCIHFIDKYIL